MSNTYLRSNTKRRHCRKPRVWQVYYKQYTMEEVWNLYYADAALHKAHTLLRLMQTMQSKCEDVCCAFCGLKPTIGILHSHKDRQELSHIQIATIDDTGKVRPFNLDHIITRSIGGRNTIGNYRLTCERCNRARGDIMSGNDLAFFKEHKNLCKHGERVYEEKVMAICY